MEAHEALPFLCWAIDWISLVQIFWEEPQWLQSWLQCSVKSRWHTFTQVFSSLCLLSLLMFEWCNCPRDIPFMAGYSIESCSQHSDQLWVSALINIHCTKKLPWWSLRASLNYRSRDTNLEDNLIPCPFNKIIVISFPWCHAPLSLDPFPCTNGSSCSHVIYSIIHPHPTRATSTSVSFPWSSFYMNPPHTQN